MGMWSEIKTVGEFREWLDDHEVSDDTPLWLGRSTLSGDYPDFDGVQKYNIAMTLHEEIFGKSLEKHQQTRKTGLVIY